MISRRSLLVAPALILPSCRLARAQSLGAGSSGGSFDPNAIIVAPNGNNANQGTLTRPVASLTRAQALVRNSRATKTVYLRAGTYNQTSTLVLTTADNGETWATYPGDPVGSAVLDYTNQAFKGTYAGLGSPNGCAIMAKGTSNLTIDSITVQNHPAIGILCYGGSPGFGFMPRAASASNVTVRNCSFINGGYGAFPPSYPGNDGQNVASGSGVYATEVPSVWFCGTLSGGLVIHNYFKTHVGTPVVIQASGVVEVSHNYLQDLNRACFDTGAIYSQFTNGCSFIYNYIRDAKSATSLVPGTDRAVRALFCDDNTQNITMRYNVVAGGAADTAGNAPSYTDTFQMAVFHGASGMDCSYNIFDMGTKPHIALLNQSSGTGNGFVGNIILSNFAGNPSSPSYGSWYLTMSHGRWTPTSPTCGLNLYHNYDGGSVYAAGNPIGNPVVGDSNPQIVDPKISGWTYNIDPASPVFSSPINFPALPSNWGTPGFWGPPGFSVPTKGTDSVPSCPY